MNPPEPYSFTRNFRFRLFICIACLVSGLSASPAWSQSAAYSVFLLGDAGAPQSGGDPVLQTLQRQLEAAGENSAIIYLGDNIYPRGLADADQPQRTEDERRLRDQLAILKNYPGKAFIVPGNHDWQQGGKNGWQRVRNQAAFVREYTGNDSIFFPKDGCPGPVEIPVNEELTVVLIDTQWWLHPWDKPGEESACEAKDLPSFLLLLEDVLIRNRHKRVILAGHHPMYSHGQHGGHFTLKDHLFPLTDLNAALYIPLPVIGSIYPLYRSLIGNIQDIPHPKYRMMRNPITQMLRDYPNVLYTNGHDHDLELIRQDSTYYLTSGSGSKRTAVKKASNSLFAAEQHGFARLDFKDNGEIHVAFFTPDEAVPTGKQLYQTTIQLPVAQPEVAENKTLPARQTAIPSRQYEAGRLKRWMLGDNYREVWRSPVTVPVLQPDKEAGGLTLLKRGGGMQTLSLRLMGANGQEYALRSVEKYAENAIPQALRSGFVRDIVQDQISAAHPYGALIVPKLAQAADVPHTNPKLVIIPDDTLLGPYRRSFAGTLALFEERPEEVAGEKKSSLFGGAEKIVSTDKLLEELYEDNDNRVDGQAVLRARLFDMWIGDWDRHDDQWRWGEFDSGKKSVFRPIPRDRDQAFFVNDGVIPWLVARKWALPKIQGFHHTIHDVPGLNFNARYFDRSFLTEPGLLEWLATADSLQTQLTDQVIDDALKALPDSAYRLTATQIKSKLQRRRQDLPKYAAELYRFLARTVDVVGSDKHERFDVLRQPDGTTEVSVYKTKKDGQTEDLLYHRTFKPSETKEIRLYGLDGEDRFYVRGNAPKSSLLRIIGGKDKDVIVDSSSVRGWSRRTVVYDKENTPVTPGNETRRRLSDKPGVNEYDRKSFKYNVLFPQASVQYNPDDGIFLGGGMLFRRHGFRKEPFAQQHRLVGNYAFATNSYNFRYDGIFTDVLGKTDLRLEGVLQAPNYVRNFFGIGNETDYDQSRSINYYRVRFENLRLNAFLQHNVGSTVFYYGPAMESVEVEENTTRFIENYARILPDSADVFKRKWYAGLKAGFVVDNRDSPTLTTRGTHWDTELTLYNGTSPTAQNLARLRSDLSFYFSVRLPALMVVATRFGGGVNFTEDYAFFQANTLGGLTNLRGFRRDRFAGKSSLYNNTEVRLKVATIRTYLFPAYAGLLAFNDVGRVWAAGESSQKWHHGYGGGIWLSPYNRAVLALMLGFSEEDTIPMLRVGFQF